MNLSELFIRRPVMTVLLNAAIIVAGVIGYRSIPIAALPSYDTPVINVSASLPGASPETMATSVALPLERQFQTIPGLATISSSSTLGNTSLTLEFAQDRNVDAAAVDVQAALLNAQGALPKDMTQLPSYRKVNPADAPVLFVSMTSPSIAPSDLQDYAEHLISPALSTLDGVAQVRVFGAKRYAVRVRVRPDALAARNIGLDELGAALAAANVNTPVGTLEGPRQTLTLQANRQLKNAADFANLIVSTRGGATVRLKDVAEVEDSIESLKTWATYNGASRISLAIQRQPGANTVQVVDEVRAALPGLQKQMPASINIVLVNDRSVSVREAIHDVSLTLAGTIALVVLVIFLFLRRFVATLIPALSLPVSLVGAVALLWGLNYSLDNISLLGLTLAVGLVVDDAIVMLENIIRHVERGVPPFQAALRGSREVGFTIISISSSLIAVFIPIFFMPGVIGLLFHEFAVIVGLAIAGLGLRLADAGADAGRPLPRRRGAQEAAGRAGARLRARLRRAARRLHAHAGPRAGAPQVGARRRARDLRRDCLAVHRDPEGLLPAGGRGPDPRSHRGRRGHLVPADGAAAGAGGGGDPRRPGGRRRELLRRR